MPYDFVTFGDAIYDIYIKPHEAEVLESCKKSRMQMVHEPMLCFGYGEKISIEEANIFTGGSAVNVAVGLSRLGLETSLISEIGSDNAGKEVENKLCEEKVNLSHIHKISGQNSFSLVLRHKKERTVLVYKAIKDYSQINFPKTLKTKWLFVSSLGNKYEEVYKRIVALVSQKGIKLALNPGRRELKEQKREFLSILKLCEVLILNKEEAEMLVGARFPLLPKEIFLKLTDFGAKINVVTDGKNGAYARNSDGQKYKVERFSDVEVLDATGAGDAFSSGFLYRLFRCHSEAPSASSVQVPPKNLSQMRVSETSSGILRPGGTQDDYTEDEIKDALVYGVINGAKVTEKIGTQPGLQSKSQMEKLVKNPPKVCKI